MNIAFLGTIQFEPENVTKKHESQASWKKVAMVVADGDICSYYSWFLLKRFNLKLNPPLRGPHITFINDSLRDMSQGGKISNDEVVEKWEAAKMKWEGKQIQIVLDINPRTDDLHWWLNIPHDHRDELHAIRAEIGLGRPHWGLHMTLGYANEKNIEHSRYIHRISKQLYA